MAGPTQTSPEALEDWLALVLEPPLEPALPIVDAHHHLWPAAKYVVGVPLPADVAAMFGDRSARGGAYLEPDYLRDTQGHNVVRTVYVENSGAFYDASLDPDLQHVGEVRHCEALSRQSTSNGVHLCAGVVGRIDFCRGAEAVDAMLRAMAHAAPTALRGVRQQTVHDGDPRVFSRCPKGLLSDRAFREGFRVLARHRLSADVVVYHPQLCEVAALALACPDVPIALDHAGTPLGVGPYEGQAAEVFKAWQAGIREVAQCPNVTVKLSGLTMPICGLGFERQPRPPTSEQLAAALAPYVHHCLQEFGPSRCMFASNFPVDKASCSFAVLCNAYKRLTAHLSPAVRQEVFSGTANRFYRLE